ncbi:MAG: hypothetical protein KZQ67_16990 [gamma proteobacterium symbiont of Bathyaustriella thionipta]|nr:hypothetical protein [gamma proteobacterium symbiont of Bathyaustriella thionipta]MCU7951679.1 hypothetical protein [gamma proteobacterium symbiont of Bathyaustriella thionipta]MCU7958276.1 hypothetical protein [gamma proteobacterium symbiont of Bathyaustriella thionipta]
MKKNNIGGKKGTELLVPQSRFRRELNQWMRRISQDNITVAVTRNKKVIAHAVPHALCEQGL